METTARSSKNQRRQQIKKEIYAWLSRQPNQRVLESDFRNKVGRPSDVHALLADQDFAVYEYKGKRWVTVFSSQAARGSAPAQKTSRNQARQDALYREPVFREKGAPEPSNREKRPMNTLDWQACVPLAGEVMRPDGTRGKSARLYVIARTYTPESAAKRLGFAPGVVRTAVASGDLPSFTDPDGKTRIPAAAIEEAADNEDILETIAGNTRLTTRQIAVVSGLAFPTVRNRLRRARINPTQPLWKQVRGLWGLPNALKEFNAILAERYPTWLESVMGEEGDEAYLREYEHEQTRAQARAEANRLRQQLIEVFPTWDRDRTEQHITLHLGPTNSGKTFSGLTSLAEAGSGWYLSPLRLLAHEVYDTLNKRGVPCNLLTGEETIEVPGAEITAATIEMFSPRQSGECIIIDEAHMLADEQRGWAWTRAIMEATAPDIHIVGSPVSEMLIYRLAEELGFSVTTERYERLTPLTVAERPWNLETLPARTILVAFSRKTVLGLKADLEKKFNRSVAVIYGNLPPEVRLRQAERFASGEAEICVATDAIGMGLNLPADNVCFYEVEKFDGKNMRMLNPNEIKQIAGRAGRYGLSEQGMVGALSKANLAVIRQALEAENTSIGFAYVAPTPESLALLPGTLEDKLRQWMTLKGIPERWRGLLKPVDLSEQITLAGMLSPANVKRLGEETSLQLISAPCANNTEPYWLACAKAIITHQPMPLPDDDLPRKITDTESLESYELFIRCADIYLWLAQRREFSKYAPEEDLVRDERRQLSEMLDAALAARIDTTRRCRSCGRPLPVQYRYNICERCYRERRYNNVAWY